MINDRTTRIIALLCLFVSFPEPSMGQDAPPVDGVWAHTFDGSRTTYLELKGRDLRVWQYMHETGDCIMYPSKVRRTEDGIEHRGGTTWHLSPGLDTLAVQMPSADTTVTYHRTTTDPRRLCLGNHNDT